jgi:hypothetical protein
LAIQLGESFFVPSREKMEGKSMVMGSRSPFKGLAWSVVFLGGVFAGLQFGRPELTNPPSRRSRQPQGK